MIISPRGGLPPCFRTAARSGTPACSAPARRSLSSQLWQGTASTWSAWHAAATRATWPQGCAARRAQKPHRLAGCGSLPCGRWARIASAARATAIAAWPCRRLPWQGMDCRLPHSRTRPETARFPRRPALPAVAFCGHRRLCRKALNSLCPWQGGGDTGCLHPAVVAPSGWRYGGLRRALGQKRGRSGALAALAAGAAAGPGFF